MEYNMQQRICDCQLRVGGCYCKLEEYDKGTKTDSEGSDKPSEQILRDWLQDKKQKD